MEDIKKEMYNEKYPRPVYIKGIKEIENQMKKSICKIYKNDGNKGTGFFCEIPYQQEKIKVMMTNNHIIDDKYIKENDKIQISMNDDKENKSIIIDNKRKIYTNEQYDITIIEIKPEKDDINNYINYMKIDEKYIKNPNIIYEKSIYLIHYPSADKGAVSFGIINKIEKYNIEHYCSTQEGSSGSPILNLLNNEIIGIHKEAINSRKVNRGTLLKYPINEFINNINNNNNFNNNIIFNNNMNNNMNNNNNMNKNIIFKSHMINNNMNNNNMNMNMNNISMVNNKMNNINIINNNMNNNIIYNNKIINNVNNNNIIINNNMNNKMNNNNMNNNNMNNNMINNNIINNNMNNNHMNNNNMNYDNMNNMNYNNKIDNNKIDNNKDNNNMNYNNMINNNNYNFNNNFINKNQQKAFNNEKNNINNNKNINEIKFRQCPYKIGLENLGNSSYMNASLQCLFNIESLSKNLINKFSTLNTNTQLLAYAYTTLLLGLKNATSKYIKPSIFKSVIGELNPLFQGEKGSDAKEFIFFIIERLHQELKLPAINQKSQINLYQQELISHNDFQSFKNFYNDLKNNKSCVFDIFYGVTKIERKYNCCCATTYSYQTFNKINFILKEIKDDKIKNIGKEYYKGINIYDAFDYMRKINILDGENMIYCNTCNRMASVFSQEMIFSLPPVLIIVLDRGKNDQQFIENFNFPEVLNFTQGNYVLCEGSYKKYYLCGLIKHLRTHNINDHFISFYRNSINEKFVAYDDTLVFENIEINDAMECIISNNNNEKMTPYILFYHYF